MSTTAKIPVKVVANTPNAERLIESLRATGYGNVAAIADIVDNSIDAGATTVNITITDTEIVVADNGTGMDFDILDQAMRLGSRVEHAEGDLGKYGMGLITSSISLGRRLRVITSDGNETWESVQDLDDIMEAKDFVRSDRQLETQNQTGTSVEITKIDRVKGIAGAKGKVPATLANEVANALGQTYRHYLWSGTAKENHSIFVNGKAVGPVDPLMWDDPGTERYSDESYELAGGRVQVKAVLLPAEAQGLKEENAQTRKQGIYVVRNNREIMTAQTFGIWHKEHKSRRVRFELQFSDDLDDVMGVDFSKQSIKPTQAVLDFFTTKLNPMRTHLRNISEKQSKVNGTEDTPDHTESERVISAKQQLLLLPKAEKEKREPGDSEGQPTPPKDDDPTRTRKPRKLQAPSANASRVNIAQGHHGAAGPLFYSYLKGHTVMVEWNYDHPFYERVLLRYKDDKDVLAALNFLVYSLGTAELKIQSEDNPVSYELVENLRSIFSGNLRSLLK